MPAARPRAAMIAPCSRTRRLQQRICPVGRGCGWSMRASSTAAPETGSPPSTGCRLEFLPRHLHRHHGPVRLGQVHAAAVRGRARPARRGRIFLGRRRPGRPVETAADPAAARAARLHLPGLQPAAVADRPQNVELPLRLAGRAPDRAGPIAAVLADRGPRATGPVTCRAQLSGGQQQRVAIARALITRPERAVRRRADRRPGHPDLRARSWPCCADWWTEHGQTVVHGHP